MDIEKLKRCLKCCADDNSKACNKCELEYGEEECQNLCGYAATALSTLQAENEKLRAELEQAGAEITRLKHYEDKCHDCPIVCAKTEIIKAHEELEAVQAELEQVKREKDAAASDLESVMAYRGDNGDNLDTCQFCKNGQCYVRGGTKQCLPQWRGQKEE